MSALPKHAKVVIIGAGIVGNSVAYHLAKLGWKDMVMIDKGPLPNPGGSTGHASNFIFPVDHSKVMTQLTLDSMAQYKAGCVSGKRWYRTGPETRAYGGTETTYGFRQSLGN